METTYVVAIDTSTGNPLYTGIPFVDLFPEQSVAQEFVTRQFNSTLRIRGHGFIGMCQAELISTIIIVDKSNVTATLPGGHQIRTIQHAFCISIPLSGAQKQNSPLEDFQLANNHYFCETIDLSHPFPPTGEPDLGFSWNQQLIQPFVQIGLRQCCITLYQGVAQTYKGSGFTETYIARRSVLNPGTRYIARGLNDYNSPGNELECELIFTQGEEYWTHIWRRGSVPIRWKTLLTSKIGTPQHIVESDFFNGTPEYFQGLLDRYGDVTIKCVSLLNRKHKENAEADVLSHYEKAVGMLYDHDIKNVFYYPFDLNKFLHSGSVETMMDFLSFIGTTGGFNHNQSSDKQQILCRFNCADSLDRTNLATFYFALMLTSEWCTKKNVGLVAQDTPLHIDQKLINFLAKAFVDSGNVISYLYTNTPAIKIDAIRQFSPIISSQSNDTLKTMQRRVENVVNDPARMKVIELWTKPAPLKWFYRLPHTHLFYFPNPQIPAALFGPKPCPYEFAPGNSATIALPMSMDLFAVMFLAYPVQKERSLSAIKISGGMTIKTMKEIITIQVPMVVDQPTWLRYRLGKPEKFGLTSSAPKFVRLVNFEFISKSKTVVIGNIKLEAHAFSQNPEYHRNLSDFHQDFTEDLEIFNSSQKKLDDLLQLETKRLLFGINEKMTISYAVSKNLNPWLFDAQSQFLAAPQNACFNCGSTDQLDSYQNGPLLLEPYIDHSKRRILLCPQCSGFSIQQVPSAVKENPSIFLTNSHFPDQRSRHSIITMSNGIFIDYPAVGVGDPHTLLTRQGGTFKLPAGCHDFSMFMAGQAFILEISVQANKPVKILVGGNEISSSLPETNFPFLDFSIQCDEDFDLQKIELTGAVTQTMEIPMCQPAKNLEGPIGQQPKVETKFDEKTRTQDLVLYRLAKVRGFTLEAGNGCGQSIVVAFFLSGNLVSFTSVVVPEVKPGTRLCYDLESVIEADRSRAFYLDRTSNCQPQNVRLLFA